jgi:PAS domain S-box-containing protein
MIKASGTLDLMPDKKHNRTLHIKLILIILMAVFLPSGLAILTASTNPLIFVGVATLVALISAISLFILLSPLDTLLKGVESFSSGNLNMRIDLRSGDEFEEMARSYNLMAEKLSHAIQSLENDKNIISFDKSKLITILSSIIDGIVAIDMSRNIVLVNKAAENMIGATQNQMVGKPLEQFIHLFSDTEEVLPNLYCKTNTIQTLNLVRGDGGKVKVNLIAAPIAEGIQTNLNCILIMHDLRAEQELEQMKFDFIDENKNKVLREELELLERSLISARQLHTLVENLLSVNKIEREQTFVSKEVVDYTPIIQKGVEDLQNQAKQKNISLALNLPREPLPKVFADQIRITEVINNLISNAINYTNAGGKVNVSVKVMPTEVVTAVEDTGVGIPQEAIPHLFTKFFRVSNKSQQMSKGTGLGLYISKSIIDKLGGRIWVESELSQGSKFYFSLPIVPHETLQNMDREKFIGQSIQQGYLNY